MVLPWRHKVYWFGLAPIPRKRENGLKNATPASGNARPFRRGNESLTYPGANSQIMLDKIIKLAIIPGDKFLLFIRLSQP